MKIFKVFYSYTVEAASLILAKDKEDAVDLFYEDRAASREVRGPPFIQLVEEYDHSTPLDKLRTTRAKFRRCCSLTFL